MLPPSAYRNHQLYHAIPLFDDLIPHYTQLSRRCRMKFGFHYLNVNYGRDYQAVLIADIALAQPAALMPSLRRQPPRGIWNDHRSRNNAGKPTQHSI
jgi:hypothetical protein